MQPYQTKESAYVKPDASGSLDGEDYAGMPLMSRS
jgi:hypothetical protein